MSQAERRAYFESIQTYFLERTGRGLVLSSRDLELIVQWHAAGVSAREVCGAVDDAIEELRSAPRDLYAVRRFVAGSASSSSFSSPGSTADPPFGENPPADHLSADFVAPPELAMPTPQNPIEAALETLAAAMSAATRPELTDGYAETTRRLHETIENNEDPWRAVYDAEDFLANAVFDRLAEDERRMIDLEIEAKHGAHLGMMQSAARESTMLEGRRRALRQRLGLVSIVK